MKHLILLVILSSLTLASSSQENNGNPHSTGPEEGTLLIVGGALQSKAIVKKFIELSGGIDAPIVVIPTAAGRDSYSANSGFAGKLIAMGATNVKVLHTNDRSYADSKEFTEPLNNAKGVWFGGGRQWRLVDAYKNTLTEKKIRAVLKNGGVVGGSSAGATIQGSYLARGDTKNNQIMTGDHQEGFSYLRNVAIDQHHLARNRHFDMFDILKKHPNLLGIGIDENTAIVVKKNKFEVIGASYVAVYDSHFWSSEGSSLKTLPTSEHLFYFLKQGDRYDLYNRKVID